ncbi:MAG TPA: hypothetical protein VN924_07215 [Bryobacteraceae bacterium]|nr:hypothetical protein [Bryobacteraceae bacterium]
MPVTLNDTFGRWGGKRSLDTRCGAGQDIPLVTLNTRDYQAVDNLTILTATAAT